MPDRFIVMPSRAQLVVLVVGVALGFAGGVFALAQGNGAIVVCGLIAAPVCGIALFDLLRRLVVPRPAFVVSAQGVLDDSSAFAAGMIYWHEIAEIVVGRQLGFVLTDRHAFLARQPFVRRTMLRFLMVVLEDAHVAIPPGLLSVATNDLINTMQAYNEIYERRIA